jgi:hypothetical protein
MTVERMFELVTDGLVFMCFFRFDFCFGFPACLFVVPVHVRKRRGHVKPAATAQFFFDCPIRQVFVKPVDLSAHAAPVIASADCK